MARTVNEQERAGKRGEIISAARRLMFSKGYERMTIADILADLKISSGAFYHYFDSKPALLDAFIEQIRLEVEKPLLPIIRDPRLSAIEKLSGFFGTLDSLRVAHKAEIIKLGRIWYTDENAIVRQKVDAAVLKQRAPLLSEIVKQGIQEGVFTVAYPEQSGEVILALLQGMGNTHAGLLLAFEPGQDQQRSVETIIAVYYAYMDAIERVLGAPSNCLNRAGVDAIKVWMGAQANSSPE